MTTTKTTAGEALGLNKLEALAKAAKCLSGHWYNAHQIADGITEENDAAYIAAANPSAILELIALARAGIAADAGQTEREKQLEAVVRAACDDLTKIHDALGLEEGGTIDADIMVLHIHHLRTARPDLAAPAAAQEGAGEVDAKDAELWRFIVRDGKSLNGRFTLVRCDGDKLTELHGGEYESAVKAAIAAQPKDTTDTRTEKN